MGVEDLVIVNSPDTLLVTRRDKAQDVQKIVANLKAAGRTEYQQHRKVYRPWGSYDSVDAGEGFQVKRITVYPNARLSLQSHQHRAEHWIVVRGSALVTRGQDTFLPSMRTSRPIFLPAPGIDSKTRESKTLY